MFFDAPDVGTYFTVSNIALTGDGAAANDTVREWLVSYPDNGFVIDYDSAGNSPSYRNGWPANVPLDAAVRFTMPDGVFMKLAGFNTFYRNTASNGSAVNDSLRVNVWAIADTNGAPDYSTVGANLFSKKVGGNDYLYNGGNFGAPFTIPLTDANMSLVLVKSLFSPSDLVPHHPVQWVGRKVIPNQHTFPVFPMNPATAVRRGFWQVMELMVFIISKRLVKN